VIASWAPHLKLDLSGCSELQAFMQRVGERPAVQAALNAEGLLG
jgi:glutathione S-transferase